MDIRVVLGLSVLLQLGAAGLALWLIRVTGKRLAWTLLAVGIALMAVRRSLSLWYMSDAGTAPTLELAAELVALLISIFMITGVALIVPLSRSIQRSEQALRESEAQFRGLCDSAFDGVVLHDGNAILEANAAFAQMFGFEKEEVTGRSMADFVAVDTGRIAHETDTRPTEEPYELEARRRDGETIRLEVCGRRTTHKGREARVIAVRDITESKKAESELRESEEKWRSLIENAPVLIMTVEHDGTIRTMNWAPEGHGPEEVIGSTVYDHVETEYHATMQTALNHVFETGKTATFENRAPGPGETISWYANNLAPVIHDDKVVLATLIATDITYRKHAEDALRHAHDDLERRVEERTSELKAANERLRHEIGERERIDAALRESEAQYRHLFQNAQVGMYRSTIDGSRMLAANEKLASIFGCDSVEELLSEPPLSRWADADARAELVMRLERDDVVTNFEVPIRTKSGERRCSRFDSSA